MEGIRKTLFLLAEEESLINGAHPVLQLVVCWGLMEECIRDGAVKRSKLEAEINKLNLERIKRERNAP